MLIWSGLLVDIYSWNGGKKIRDTSQTDHCKQHMKEIPYKPFCSIAVSMGSNNITSELATCTLTMIRYLNLDVNGTHINKLAGVTFSLSLGFIYLNARICLPICKCYTTKVYTETSSLHDGLLCLITPSSLA